MLALSTASWRAATMQIYSDANRLACALALSSYAFLSFLYSKDASLLAGSLMLGSESNS